MNSVKRNAFGLAAMLVTGLQAWTVNAAPAQVPLFLGGSIEPNVMFTLDDSGSMHWEMMPDSLRYPYFVYPRQPNLYHSSKEYGNYVISFDQSNNVYDRWVRSSAINKIYYNPAVSYRPWVWIPTAAGIFAVVVSASLGFISRPSRNDLIIYAVTMMLMCLVGIVGFMLHVNTNLIANGSILLERFVRGSPFLAPLVFANWGLIGLVALLNPAEESGG